jgi:hypothetical protein
MSEQKLPFEAYKGKEPYIFISYAHKDSALVFKELIRIRSWGLNVWYDEGIDPGSEWPDEIAVALKNCTLFLYFVTPRAVASVNCRNEVYYALNYKKPFLCIYLEKTDIGAINPGLELSIGSLQAILKYQMDDLSYTRKLSKSLGKPIPLGELEPDKREPVEGSLSESPVVRFSPPVSTGPAPGSPHHPQASPAPMAPSASGLGKGIPIRAVLVLIFGGAVAVMLAAFSYYCFYGSAEVIAPMVKASPTENPTFTFNPSVAPKPPETPTPTQTHPPVANGAMRFVTPVGGHYVISLNEAVLKNGDIPDVVTDLKSGSYQVTITSQGVTFSFPAELKGKESVNEPDPALLAALAEKTENPVDLYNAGFCYFMGWGVNKDHAQAAPWFQKAAEKGHIGAAVSLGYLYHIGSGVPHDDAAAMVWYKKAADGGSGGAQISVGLLYISGAGLTGPDYANALKYFTMAADQGIPQAQANVGIMYFMGQGVPVDYTKADHWLQLAAIQGDPNALFMLGQMAYFAKGEPKDIAKAKAYWKKAAEKGSQRASDLLKQMGG